MRETWVLSLGWEDSLEKRMAIHRNILAWKIPWPEEPVRLPSMGSKRVQHDRMTFIYVMTLSYKPWAGNTLMYVNMIPCLWHNTVNKFFISHSITSAVGVFISTFKNGDPIWWLSMKGLFMQKKTGDIKYWRYNMKGQKATFYSEFL